MEDISHSCSLFNEPASNIDFTFALILIEIIIFRLYYGFRFPYGSFEWLIKTFPFLGFLAYKNKVKQNEDTPNKLHQEKYVESKWSTRSIMFGIYIVPLSIFLYFRMDRFYIIQHTPLKYFAPFIYQLSKFIICSGDITFIPRDSTIAFFLRIMGLFIAQYSAIFFLWVHQEMQASWTPFIHLKQDHRLVTSGPFRIVRHPMYFSGVLMVIGGALSSWNWILGFLRFFNILNLLLRIPVEEKLLSETYGAEYQKFRSTTKYAVIPFVY